MSYDPKTLRLSVPWTSTSDNIIFREPDHDLHFPSDSLLCSGIPVYSSHQETACSARISVAENPHTSYEILNVSLPRKATALWQVSPTKTFFGDRFWAIIIGLNDYIAPETSSLASAASDADAVCAFLMQTLLVPRSHIDLLINCSATRKNITGAWLRLLNNPEVCRGDNILIYFAGHGSAYPSVEEYFGVPIDLMDIVEVICPSDRGTCNADGRVVPDISDCEVNNFIEDLAAKHGNNITVVLDCSHSAHTIRRRYAAGVHYTGPRGTVPVYQGSLRQYLDGPIDPSDRWALRSVSASSWRPNPLSYVMLTACIDDEPAVEDSNGGFFTRALLRALRTSEAQRMSYIGLWERIGLLGFQCPVLVGARSEEPVWFRDSISDFKQFCSSDGILLQSAQSL